MQGAAVDAFYRVAFRDDSSFRQWTERVTEFAAIARHILADRSEMRPVVFVPQGPARGTPLRAYVSPGARGMAMRISDGVLIDRTLVTAADLPEGLTMILGDGVDEAEYAKRTLRRRG